MDAVGSIAILGGPTTANTLLVAGFGRLGLDALVVPPVDARSRVGPGDVAIARPDVLPSLDGVEEGFLELLWLERSGTRVVNSVRSLLAAHDKLRTARLLTSAGLAHPRTEHVTDVQALARAEPPVVVKPRFGSWGHDVIRCLDRDELGRCVEAVRDRPWFRRHGALVQELLPPRERDLRILVAAGSVVGAAERRAAPGEWRTNVSLGGSRRSTEPPPAACELALAAAAATGGELVGVDLFPGWVEDWVVLELNGAAEFDDVYSLPGRDVYADLVAALGLEQHARSRHAILAR
jgi:RimK family alpha-L-glutamate ligase